MLIEANKLTCMPRLRSELAKRFAVLKRLYRGLLCHSKWRHSIRISVHCPFHVWLREVLHKVYRPLPFCIRIHGFKQGFFPEGGSRYVQKVYVCISMSTWILLKFWTYLRTTVLSGFSVGFCINEEEGYLLPTIARKITYHFPSYSW